MIPMGENWHHIEMDQVLFVLGTDKSTGLTEIEVKKRLKQYGLNELPKVKKKSYFSIFLHQFLSPLIYILLIAAAIAFYIGETRDAIVVLIVVFLNSIIGAFQEGRAEQSLESLRQLSKNVVKVIRDGKEQIVEASRLVIGDIVVLSSGDAVPSDARIIESASLFVAEAALTGESMPVAKSNQVLDLQVPLADRLNMVFAGTHVTAGRGLAVVTSTGIKNEIGKISNMATSATQPKTLLEKRVEVLGKYLAVISLVLFVVIILFGLWKNIPFSQIFMIAISQLVSLVPEGLPVAITIALSVGVQRMARRGTIVRRMPAVETLGSTTVICSDKTGTLTKNEMTVTLLYLPFERRSVHVSGVGYSPDGKFLEDQKTIDISKDKTIQQLLLASVLCNDSHLQNPSSNEKHWRVIGDPTEGALITLALKAGVNVDVIRKQMPRIAELPFDSNSKMMATQHKKNDQNIVFIKGAPEMVLDLCNTLYNNDEVKEMNASIHAELSQTIKNMGEAALRLLAVAYVQNEIIEGDSGFKRFKNKATLIGIVGEIDPPREEIVESIQQCQTAGVRTVMVTGDHKQTGSAIAKSLGISKENDLAIDGVELEKLSDVELKSQIENVSVFARVHPGQKLRIIEALQENGEIVAMTGDGVNDAPALIRANVGVAMGITGTEVAKEAAKIVITDDNFATIVAAIAEGRLVHKNIKKLLLFLIVTSIDEVVVLLLALFFGYPPPLAAVQILWINLVTEGALTVNLIMEPPEGDEMLQPPIPMQQPLLDRNILKRIPLMVISSVAATFGWFIYRTTQGASKELIQTETFTMLVVCQWFNILNCRSDKKSVFNWDLFKNPWLMGGLLLANILHIAVIYWPSLSRFFHTVPIDPKNILQIGFIASSVLLVEEVRKYFVRRQNHLNIK